jgi:hypothetical protein
MSSSAPRVLSRREASPPHMFVRHRVMRHSQIGRAIRLSSRLPVDSWLASRNARRTLLTTSADSLLYTRSQRLPHSSQSAADGRMVCTRNACDLSVPPAIHSMSPAAHRSLRSYEPATMPPAAGPTHHISMRIDILLQAYS